MFGTFMLICLPSELNPLSSPSGQAGPSPLVFTVPSLTPTRGNTLPLVSLSGKPACSCCLVDMNVQDADQAMQELFGPLLGKRNTPAEDAAKESQTERPSKAGRQNDGGKGRGHNRRLVVLKDSKLKDTPLRQAMFWSFMEFLGTTLENMSEAAIKQAKDSGWLNEQGHWVFQCWNSELKALEVDVRRSSLPELLQTIKAIQKLIHRDTLSRFHILQRLEHEKEGQTVRVMMDVALRCPEATELYQLLSTLQGNASLQVAGLQFRQATMQRPPVIKQLMEHVFG
eukprot:s6551_g3.t1